MMAEDQLTNIGPGATERRGLDATAEIFRSKGLAKEMGFEPEPAREVPAEPEYTPQPNTATEGEETPDPEPVETPAAEPAKPEAPPEPKKFKVKADGRDLEVTEEELIRGYRRDVDWQKDRAETQAERQKINAERQHYAQQLQTLVPAVQQQIAAEFADIKTLADVQTMAKDDPARFTQWQAKQMALQQLTAEQERVANQQQRETEKQWNERRDSEMKKLSEAIPDFKDESKRTPFMDKLRGYLRAEIGYSEDEISRAIDHRDIVTAWKAMQWDEAQKAKKAVKTVDVPTPVKPGRAASPAGKGEEINAARGALKKTGSLNAFADVLKRRGLN
jgi:hypothetical protein